MKHDTDRGRFYDIGRVRYPSVTTILKVIDRPALIPWAANLERAACTEAAADLYAAWAAQTVRPIMPRAAFLSTLAVTLGPVRAHQKTLAAAGDIGTEAHKLIEWTLRRAVGAEAGPEPVVGQPARWAFQTFLAWAHDVKLKPILIERTVWSTRDGYAGTMDLLARVEGVLTCIDFKTGKAIYPEAHLQSAAYRTALEHMGYPVVAGLIVRLPKVLGDPGFDTAAVAPAAALCPTFLAARQLWAWSYQNETARRRGRGKARAKVA